MAWYLNAASGKGHGIHSPFVFDFVTRVLNDKTKYPAYDAVERLRQTLLKDNRVLKVEDFGAGSGVDKSNRRSISSITKHAVKPAKFGQLLFRMVQYYQPATILELGTSLGITSSYLSLAMPGAELTTMEGAPAIAAAAIKNFQSLQTPPIRLIEGNFDDTLPETIKNYSSIDFAFIDGNHRREPTIRYFNTICSKARQSSILVLDDIHWSREMEEAWRTIKSHASVRCSIDLFFIGIIFFKDGFKEKQNFKIRY